MVRQVELPTSAMMAIHGLSDTICEGMRTMVNLDKRAPVSLAKSETPIRRLKACDTYSVWAVRAGVHRNNLDALSAAFKTGVSL